MQCVCALCVSGCQPLRWCCVTAAVQPPELAAHNDTLDILMMPALVHYWRYLPPRLQPGTELMCTNSISTHRRPLRLHSLMPWQNVDKLNEDARPLPPPFTETSHVKTPPSTSVFIARFLMWTCHFLGESDTCELPLWMQIYTCGKGIVPCNTTWKCGKKATDIEQNILFTDELRFIMWSCDVTLMG